jgi:hypothetical protein
MPIMSIVKSAITGVAFTVAGVLAVQGGAALAVPYVMSWTSVATEWGAVHSAATATLAAFSTSSIALSWPVMFGGAGAGIVSQLK